MSISRKTEALCPAYNANMWIGVPGAPVCVETGVPLHFYIPGSSDNPVADWSIRVLVEVRNFIPVIYKC